MQTPAIVLLGLAAGALLAAQGPIFVRSAGYLGGPIQAATLAFAVGLCALVSLCLLTGGGLPKVEGMARMPAWLWAGGLIGTTMVLLTLYAVPRVGVATFIAAVVCGQLLAAMAYDHVGAFGLQLRRLDLWDIGGAVLLLTGLAMMTSGNRQ